MSWRELGTRVERSLLDQLLYPTLQATTPLLYALSQRTRLRDIFHETDGADWKDIALNHSVPDSGIKIGALTEDEGRNVAEEVYGVVRIWSYV